MSINAYSSYASYLSNLGGIQRTQSNLNTLLEQLNTEKKSTDLTFYGADSTRLLDLRADISKRQGYMQTIDGAQTDVKAYDAAFTSLEDLASQMMDAFTAPESDPPTLQQHQVTLKGDIGDAGDVYKVTVDGVVFSYVTTGLEGNLDEIAGNLTAQINAHQPPLQGTATSTGGVITITGKEPGPLYDVSATMTDVDGGKTNSISAVLTQQGKVSPIVAQVNNALTQVMALLNERVNDRYLFGGLNINNQMPVVDLSRLPDPTGSKNAISDATTQQLAPGTIVQEMRITADYLGTNQTETFTVNGTPLTFTGPLTQQQLASQLATAITGNPALTGITVQDVDGQGLTIKSTTPGTGFSVSITGTDPTPSTAKTVQANVPLGANQVDKITLSGPVGVIGETYSVTIMDPPNNTAPVTISYRTTGDEKDLNEIAGKLVDQINAHKPPFTVSVTNTGNGTLQLSSATGFTSHSGVGESAQVATTQRTVVPVAQQEEVSFPGPFGEAGDQYSISFTAPVGGPFTVTTSTFDTEESVAQQMADQINAAGLGVSAVIRNGHLSVTSDTPGVPFTMTSALTVDGGTTTTTPPVQTQTVANIPPGPLSQVDEVSLSGPVGRKGDVYELTVNGRTIRYTTDGTEQDMDAIAIHLTALANSQTPPFPASAVAGPTGSGKLILTGTTPGVELKTEVKVANPMPVTSPAAPDYSTYQEPTDSSLAWQRGTITVADNTNLKYTYSANDPAMQKLIMALRYAQSAVGDPANYQSKMDVAKQLAQDSLTGVRALHSDNTVNDTVMSAASLAHQTSINLFSDSTEKIEGVDQNEVAAKIQAAQLQLQTSFAAFASTARLSLVNFIA